MQNNNMYFKRSDLDYYLENRNKETLSAHEKEIIVGIEKRINELENEYNQLVEYLKSNKENKTQEAFLKRERAMLLQSILENLYDKILEKMTNEEILGLIPGDWGVMVLYFDDYVDSNGLFFIRADKMLSRRKNVSNALQKKYGSRVTVIN